LSSSSARPRGRRRPCSPTEVSGLSSRPRRAVHRADEAPKEEDKERIARGLSSKGAATPKAINLDLEARIRAQPDDPSNYLVYADWLEQHDDPRGALIPIHAQLLEEPTNGKLRAAEKALLEEHGAYLLPPNLHALLRVPRSLCRVGWRYGFLDEAHLAQRGGEEVEDREIPALVSALLCHPSAHFRRKLSIGSLGTTKEYSYLASVQAIATARHPRLREVFLGDFEPMVMDLAFSRIGNASPLLVAEATPALERLTLRAGSRRFDGAIRHPVLKEVRSTAAALTASALTRIFACALPELEVFELSCPRLAIDPAALVQMLRSHPKLKKLALRQTVRTETLVDALLAAPAVLRGLSLLELDDGDTREAAASSIVSRAKRLGVAPRIVLGRAGTAPIADADVVARAPTRGRSLPPARWRSRTSGSGSPATAPACGERSRAATTTTCSPASTMSGRRAAPARAPRSRANTRSRSSSSLPHSTVRGAARADHARHPDARAAGLSNALGSPAADPDLVAPS